MKTVIRQLRIRERVPSSEPKRYRSQRGYIRLRWKIGPYSYVEVYEHRVADGVVVSSEHVHHRNGIKNDNRPENLAPLTTMDHGSAHSRVNHHEAAELYAQGWSLPRLSERYGVHCVTVMRSLKLRGVKMRTLREAWVLRRAS